MRVRVSGVLAPLVCVLLLAGAPSRAQAPVPVPPAQPQAPLPVPGFMPPYEITRVARAAGFEPLAPPLREGTTYVLRATDFRGILMRVVVDAHSGAIRAVNRIVAGPAYPNPVGMAPPPYPYGVPAYGPYGRPVYGGPAYGGPPQGPPYAALPTEAPPDYDGPEMPPSEQRAAVPPPPPPPPPSIHSAARAPISGPPLPRPRPATLASRKADDAGAAAKTEQTTASPPAAVAAPAVPDVKPAATAPNAPAAASAAPVNPPPKPANKPEPVPLND